MDENEDATRTKYENAASMEVTSETSDIEVFTEPVATPLSQLSLLQLIRTIQQTTLCLLQEVLQMHGATTETMVQPAKTYHNVTGNLRLE